MVFNDYYKILGIKKTSSLDEIKSAYRKLSKKFHPDVNNGDEYFQERFKEIQEAYETLSNLEKRRIYDLKYEGFYITDSPPKPPPQPRSSNPPRPQPDSKLVKKSNSQSWVGIVVFILIISFISAIIKGIRDDSANKITDKNIIKVDTLDLSHSLIENKQKVDSIQLNNNKIKDSITSEAVVTKIRKTVEKINKDTAYTIKTLENEEFLEHMPDGGGQLIGYFKNDQLVKIIERIGFSSCINITEYYIQDNKLVFAYTQGKEFQYIDSLQTFNTNKQAVTMECRFYFDHGQMIKSILKGATRCGGNPQNSFAEHYQNDCLRYIILLTKK